MKPGPRSAWALASWCTRAVDPDEDAPDVGAAYDAGYEDGRRSILDRLRALLDIGADVGGPENDEDGYEAGRGSTL